MAKIGFSVGSMLREKKDPNKEVPLYITVHKDGVRVVRQYIPFKVKPKDYSKGEITNDPDLNDDLQDYKARVRKWMLNYNKLNGYYPSPEEIVLYLKSVFGGKGKDTPDFKNDFESFYVKDKKVREASIRNRAALLSNLESYCDHTGQALNYSDIQNGFIKGFEDYLRDVRNLRESSIETRLRTLRAFMKEAWVRDRHNIDVDKFPKFVRSTNKSPERKKEDELRYITIDHEDILKIKGLELPGRLAETRDIALILYIYALRISDSRKINTGNLNKQKTHFIYTQTKTSKGEVREKEMKVPVKNKVADVMEILERYGGGLPDLPLHELNSDLRTIGAMINKKYVLIASHTFRRSRITNLLDEGVSRESIMILSGHEDLSSLELYVKKESSTFRNRMEEAI